MNSCDMAIDGYKHISIVCLFCLVLIAVPAMAAEPVFGCSRRRTPRNWSSLRGVSCVDTCKSSTALARSRPRTLPPDADVAILIGSPETNPLVAPGPWAGRLARSD